MSATGQEMQATNTQQEMLNFTGEPPIKNTCQLKLDTNTLYKWTGIRKMLKSSYFTSKMKDSRKPAPPSPWFEVELLVHFYGSS